MISTLETPLTLGVRAINFVEQQAFGECERPGKRMVGKLPSSEIFVIFLILFFFLGADM